MGNTVIFCPRDYCMVSAKISCAYQLQTTKYRGKAVIFLSKGSLHPITRIEKDTELKENIIRNFDQKGCPNGPQMEPKWGPRGVKNWYFSKKGPKRDQVRNQNAITQMSPPLFREFGEKRDPQGDPKIHPGGTFFLFLGSQGGPKTNFLPKMQKN